MYFDNQFFDQTRKDIDEDFDELLYLLDDCQHRLIGFLRDIQKAKKHIAETTYQEVSEHARRLVVLSQDQKRNIARLRQKVRSSYSWIDEARGVKQAVFEFLRTHQTRIGALITSTDWQSPSFLHSGSSQAGRQTNTIYATINDYKRDQHWDAHRYEQAFLKEYVDGFIKFPITICATSSGMAAFTTIFNFLLLEGIARGKILIGTSIYFENRELVTRMFGNTIVTIDEHDTKAFLAAFDRHKPSIVFIDSLANAPDVSVPDLNSIVRHIVSRATSETYLVVDNTGLSLMFQPYPLLFGRKTNVRLVVFESLNKYHQFGMDRVTGGILWTYGKNTAKLFDYRVHLGTNIPDLIAASLPAPNRKLLTKRLMRHSRNAAILASRLQQWIDGHPDSPFSYISFPGLPNHSAYTRIGQPYFYGSYFTVAFKKKFQTVTTYKRFVTHVLKIAKRHHVDMVSGTSFGLTTTRVYLTAIRSTPHTPFVRVAVGTEHRRAIEALAISLEQAFNSFR